MRKLIVATGLAIALSLIPNAHAGKDAEHAKRLAKRGAIGDFGAWRVTSNYRPNEFDIYHFAKGREQHFTIADGRVIEVYVTYRKGNRTSTHQVFNNEAAGLVGEKISDLRDGEKGSRQFTLELGRTRSGKRLGGRYFRSFYEHQASGEYFVKADGTVKGTRFGRTSLGTITKQVEDPTPDKMYQLVRKQAYRRLTALP